MQRWWPDLAAGVTGSRVSTPVRGAGPRIDRWWRPESLARPSLSRPHPHAGELRPGEPVVAAADPVAEGIRRVLEQGRVVEPGEGPHGQGTLDRVVADVGCRSDGTVGGPDALQPRPAPREIAVQPRPQRHEGEQEGEHHCDDEDELLQLRAEVGQRPAGAGKGVTGKVADLRPDQRQAGQRVAQVAPALDHVLAASADGPAGLGEAGQELEQLPDDVPPEHHPQERREVRDLFLDPRDRQLAPDPVSYTHLTLPTNRE